MYPGHFITLLDKSDIKHSLVGRDRRVRAEDLFAYELARDSNRSESLANLAEMDAEHL